MNEDVAASKDDGIDHDKSLMPLKVALWIHCLAQLVMAATVVYYIEHFEKYLLIKHRGMKLPAFIQDVVHLRHALWLLPMAFIIVASWMSLRRKSEAACTTLFAACSILVLVCTISFAVFVTRSPFGYPIILIKTP